MNSIILNSIYKATDFFTYDVIFSVPMVTTIRGLSHKSRQVAVTYDLTLVDVIRGNDYVLRHNFIRKNNFV